MARKPIGPGTRNCRNLYKHRLIIQDTDFSNEENTSEYVPSSRGSTLESKLEYPNNLLKTPGEYKIRQNKRKLVRMTNTKMETSCGEGGGECVKISLIKNLFSCYSLAENIPTEANQDRIRMWKITGRSRLHNNVQSINQSINEISPFLIPPSPVIKFSLEPL